MRHIHLEQCDSTQDVLERQLEEVPGEDLLISASLQSQGRGRGHNSWEHQSGALAFSFSAPPHPQSTWQSLEVAVCMANFLQDRFAPAEIALKWPNDLYSAGKKCGGIIIKNQGNRVLIGIGLNLLPCAAWGHVLNEDNQFHPSWQSLIPADFVRSYLLTRPLPIEGLQHEFNRLCLHLGKYVKITEGSSVVEGIFTGLGSHGEALIKNDAHTFEVFNGSLRWED